MFVEKSAHDIRQKYGFKKHSVLEEREMKMEKDIEYYESMFVNKSALSMENLEDIQKAGIELVKEIKRLAWNFEMMSQDVDTWKSLWEEAKSEADTIPKLQQRYMDLLLDRDSWCSKAERYEKGLKEISALGMCSNSECNKHYIARNTIAY